VRFLNYNKQLYQLRLNDFGEIVNVLGFLHDLDTQKSIIRVSPGYIVTNKDGVQHIAGSPIQIGNPRFETGEPVRTFEDFKRWNESAENSGYTITQDETSPAVDTPRYSKEQEYSNYKVSFDSSVDLIFETAQKFPESSEETGVGGKKTKKQEKEQKERNKLLAYRLNYYREQMYFDIDMSELSDEQKNELKGIVDKKFSERYEAVTNAALILEGFHSHEDKLFLGKFALSQERLARTTSFSERLLVSLREKEKNICSENSKNSKECKSLTQQIEHHSSIINTNRFVSSMMGGFRGENQDLINGVLRHTRERTEGSSKNVSSEMDEILAEIVMGGEFLSEEELELYKIYSSGSNPFEMQEFVSAYTSTLTLNQRDGFSYQYNNDINKKNAANVKMIATFNEIDDSVSSIIEESFPGVKVQDLKNSTSHGTLIHGILSIEDDEERFRLVSAYRDALRNFIYPTEEGEQSKSGKTRSFGLRIIDIIESKVLVDGKAKKFDSKKIDGVDKVLTKIENINLILGLYSLTFDPYSPNSSVDSKRRLALGLLTRSGITFENIKLAQVSLFSMGFTEDGTIHEGFKNEVLESMNSKTRKEYDGIKDNQEQVMYLLKYYHENYKNIVISAETAASARLRSAHGRDFTSVDTSGVNDIEDALVGPRSVFSTDELGQRSFSERMYDLGSAVAKFKKEGDRKGLRNYLNSEIDGILDSLGFNESHPGREDLRKWIVENVESFVPATKGKSKNLASDSNYAAVGLFTEFLGSLGVVASLMSDGDTLTTHKTKGGKYTYDEIRVVGKNGKVKYRVVSSDAKNGYSDAVVVSYDDKSGKLKKIQSLEYKTHASDAFDVAKVNDTEPYRFMLMFIKNNSVNNLEEGDVDDEVLVTGELVQLTITNSGRTVSTHTGLRGKAIGRAASGNYFVNYAQRERKILDRKRGD
jgi:hypothetical protein